MSFSDNLKTIRKEKNLSQEELAELLGVSRQAVSKWELGDGYPEAEKLLIIAGKLNVSLDALMDTEIVNTAVNKHNAPGQITITSPYEGVIVRCNKVVKSQKFKGGKASPKYALFAQDQNERSFWGATNTFLGWYILMILYDIICKARGKKSYGTWAIGFCLLLIPIFVIGVAFLICGIFMGK